MAAVTTPQRTHAFRDRSPRLHSRNRSVVHVYVPDTPHRRAPSLQSQRSRRKRRSVGSRISPLGCQAPATLFPLCAWPTHAGDEDTPQQSGEPASGKAHTLPRTHPGARRTLISMSAKATAAIPARMIRQADCGLNPSLSSRVPVGTGTGTEDEEGAEEALDNPTNEAISASVSARL